MALDPGHRGRDRAEIRNRGSRDAGHRYIIDEARSVSENGRKPRVIGRRRREADEVQPCLQSRQAQLRIFLRRQIDDDQAIDARRAGIAQEAVDAISIDRVVIAHQHDWRVGVSRAEITDERQRLLQRLAACKRAQSGRLDRRAVGHRIGEGHAEFDDVGARSGQGLQDFERGLVAGIAGHDEGDERGAALGLAGCEAAVDAGAHSFVPRMSATCGTSLSPRPERLITMR